MGYYILIGWIVCTIVAAGIILADFCSIGAEHGIEFHDTFLKYRYGSHIRFAWALSLLGPVALCSGIVASGFLKHGWMNPFKFTYKGLK